MKDCNNCNFLFRKKEKANGDFMLIKQCKSCGKDDGKMYKFSEVGGKESVIRLPLFDIDLQNEYYKKQQEKRHNEYLEKRQELLNEYSVYLGSEKWSLKRETVLKRDNYICKACETNKATEVHHLTYEFIYNEPLFDLVSVCKPCHDKIEKIKKEKRGII